MRCAGSAGMAAWRLAPTPRPFHVRLSPAQFAPRGLDRWIGYALLAVFACLWIASLGDVVLLSPDEGRYATISLDMLRSGDWITPRLNGLLYFEKPPLQYWGGALAFALFGPTEFAARLWPGLAGLFSVLMTAYTARQLWGGRAGALACAIAGSTTWIVANSHFLSLDAGLNGALTLTLCAFLLAEQPDRTPASQRRWMLAAWLGMALAVLSKGLIGVLIPGTVLVLITLWRRDWALWLRLQWLGGLAVFLVVAAPWFVLVSMRNPDFAWFFFIHEHFQRYLTTEHQRTGAWWYFLPFLFVGLMPWVSGLPWLLRARRTHFATSLLVIWAVFVFVFFSVSGSKLPSYILPMFPALALLAARALDAVADDIRAVRRLRWHLLIPALAWVAILVVSLRAQHFASPEVPAAALQTMARTLTVCALAFLIGGVSAWWMLGRGRLIPAVLLIAALQFCAAHGDFRAVKSAAGIVQRMAPRLTLQTVVYSVGSYDQTLPFYLRRDVVLVDYRDEFAFGQDHEPQRWISSVDAFLERWQQAPDAAAYLTTTAYAELRKRGLDGDVVYEDPRRVVVMKSAPPSTLKIEP